MDHLQEATYKIIKEQFGIEVVDDTAHLIQDLGGDLLDIIELVMSIEETFNVEISDLEAENIQTVQDVYECIKKVSSNER